MSKRYTTPGPWSVSRAHTAGPGTVSVFIGPAVDTKTGVTYPEGAHKVCISGPTGKPRSRTFIGESAWNNAERWAEDACQWLVRWSRDHANA